MIDCVYTEAILKDNILALLLNTLPLTCFGSLKPNIASVKM